MTDRSLIRRWWVAVCAVLVGFVIAAFAASRMTSVGPTHPVLPASSASATGVGPVVVVAVPRLSWDDVSPARTPDLWSLVQVSAVGAESVRATSAGTCDTEAWLSLGAGTGSAIDCASALHLRVTGGVATWPQWSAWRERAPQIGTLGSAYAGKGACIQAVGPGAALAAADASGRVAHYAPTPAGVKFGACPLTLVDLGRGATVTDLNSVAGRLPPNADLVVTGLADSAHAVGGEAARTRLLLLAGPAVTPGLLQSGSTRQPGFVRSSDLTATLLSRVVGASLPSGVDGQPLRVSAAAPQSSVERLRDRGGELRAQYAALTPVWSVWALGVVALVLYAGWLLLHRADVPRWLALVAIWWAGFPAGSFLAGWVPWWRWPWPGVWLFVVCGVFAAMICAVACAGPRAPSTGARFTGRPAAVVCAITWMVLALDVCSGSRLQFTSTLGLQPLLGGRYYGMGNVGFGLFATATLLGAGLAAAWLVARRQRRLAAATIGLAVLVSIVVDAVPGADFGGPPALLIGGAVMAVLALGGVVSWRKAAAISGAAVILAVVVAVADWLRAPASRTHLGRFVQSVLDGHGSGIVWEKLGANLRMLVSNPLNPIIPIVLVLLILAVLSPTSRLGRLLGPLWRIPFLREVCLGLFACWGVALLINDSGIAIPAIGGMLAVPLAVGLVAEHAQTPDPLLSAGGGDARG